MSDLEILKGCEERLKGKTWNEAGKVIGYTGGALRGAVLEYIVRTTNRKRGSGRYTNVRHWMVRNGVGTHEFASMLGYGHSHISLILTGANPMPDTVLEQIQKVTGLTREEILVFEEKKKAPSGAKAETGAHKKQAP